MATNLYLERRAAENISEELRRVYKTGDFERRGFNKVEFNKLFGKAKKRVLHRGRALIKEGTHPNVYFFVKGSIDIRQGDCMLARLEGHDESHLFLGEMTLLDRLRSANYEDAFASTDAVVVSDDVVVYEWQYEDMLKLLAQEHEVQNALLAYISFDLQSKLHEANANQVHLLKTTLS